MRSDLADGLGGSIRTDCGYGYDGNGNLLQRPGLALVWNVENRLASATVSGASVESYSYNDAGIRVKKVSGGVTTHYPFPHYEVQVSATNVTTTTKYYFFAGQRIAMQRGSEPLTFLHGDHLNSTALATRGGATNGQERYYAYGKDRLATATVPTDNRFTGQKEDGTGLVYMNARYYDPVTGQFVSPDTLVPDATNLFDYNRYMYVRGNPLKYTDSTGHFTEEQLAGWYGEDWRSKFSAEWQALLFDQPGSQILGAQLGDVIMMQDANSIMSQQVLVMGPSGSTPVLWNPNSKDWAPLHSFGQQSSVEIALYRIQGGETGAADNYWSYLTGGTNSLPATNGAGGDSDGILLNRVSGSSSLPGQSTLSSSWFLGRSDRGSSFVSNNRRFDSVDWSAPNLAEGALTTIVPN
jgi:RHS repeat-associated protein